MNFFVQIFIFQLFLFKKFKGLIFLKKCDNYLYLISKVSHNNYFLKTTYIEYYHNHTYVQDSDGDWYPVYWCEETDDIQKQYPSSSTLYNPCYHDIYCSLSASGILPKAILSQKMYRNSFGETLCQNDNYICTVDIVLLSPNILEGNIISINYDRINSNNNNGTSTIVFYI